MHSAFDHGGFPNPDRVIIEGDVGLPGLVQDAPDGLPHATVTTNHHMALHPGVKRADFLQLRLFVGLAVQTCGNPGRGAQQRRSDHHRAKRRRQQQAAEPGGHQVVLLHLRHQCKAEFTPLSQGQAAAPGGLPVAAT